MRPFPIHTCHRIVRSIGLLSVLLISLWPHVVNGQSPQLQPVARLVSSSLDSGRGRATPAEIEAAASTNSAFPTLEDANSIERHAFEQTNLVRAKHGLPPFVWDAQLCRLARAHSESMGRLKFFGHATPDGLRLQDRARSAGIRYQVIAENIAFNKGYDDPGAFAVERWMLSPGHRANILYAGFSAMAVGTFVTADGSIFLTQTFITR